MPVTGVHTPSFLSIIIDKIFEHHAHAVAVGIGADDHVRVHLVRVADGQREGLRVLRVGALHRGEGAVRLFLFLHHGDVLVPGLFERRAHQLVARAVQGRVDDLQLHARAGKQVLVRAERKDMVYIGFVHFAADDADKRTFKRRQHIDRKGIERLHFPEHRVCRVRRDLAAVRAVGLEAVVLRGIMAGRYHDACCAVQVLDGEAQLRRGAKTVEQVHLNAHVGDDFRGILRKLAAEMPGIVGDGNAAFAFRRAGFQQVRGQALGGTAHGVYVHAVGAHAQDAP